MSLTVPNWTNETDLKALSLSQKWGNFDSEQIDAGLRRAEMLVESLVGAPVTSPSEQTQLATYMIAEMMILGFSDASIVAEARGYNMERMTDYTWSRSNTGNPFLTPTVVSLLAPIVPAPKRVENLTMAVPGDAEYVGPELYADYTVPDLPVVEESEY